MRKRPVEQAWRNALTVVALAATAMALYLQVFERRSRQEEARLAAVRLDDALAASRVRLRAEVLAELRAELSRETDEDRSGQPAPDAVLRRLETGGDARGGSSLEAFRPEEARVIAGLGESLESLTRQVEDSDRALRRELEELRAATLREADVSSKTAVLTLIALLCLTGQLLPALWPGGRGIGE